MERVGVRPLRRGAHALAGGPHACVQACNAVVEQLESRVLLAANPIVLENERPGTPESEWSISRAGDLTLQGFATDISVDQGQTVYFKIDDKDGAPYRLDIYRMGYYQGLGARKIATFYSSANRQIAQPAGLYDPTTGLLDCGNWSVTDSWRVPATATSGIYFAKITRLDTGGASHVYFIVRDDDGRSDMLFQTSDVTWQAYNNYGGRSIYDHQSNDAKASKISYNRPFNDMENDGVNSFVFTQEFPMVEWLEKNGYNVSYFTGVDTARYGKELLEHKAFLSVGHDEYWSAKMRTNMEAARDAGVNLAFFSGNEGFWKVRWENSIDGSGTPYRTLVCYKESEIGAKRDPLPDVWTGTWRDPRVSPPADGGLPENALTGTLSMVSSQRNDPIYVPAEDGKLRFWRNTSIANLAPGQTATLPNGVLGYEWDVDADNGFRPAGLINLSHTTLQVDKLLVSDNATYAPGAATHSLTLYRAASGALVFGAGTVQWSWGLEPGHMPNAKWQGPTVADARMQQATVNLFADMGIFPRTLQAGLVMASTSKDFTPPVSTITWSPAGLDIKLGDLVTITGTAYDLGGGVVGGIEVSVDGGATWHEADGRDNWQYTWRVTEGGTAHVLSRATDDSLRMETPGPGVSVAVPGPDPESIWSDRTLPIGVPMRDPEVAGAGGIELGMKFRSDVTGQVLGVRFYKFYQNTGVHVGTLWSSAGELLAQATFANETESGWQRVFFSNPVTIQAGQTYVVSYHTTKDYYADDYYYFTSTGVDNGPLHALRSGVDGGNGVYKYGTGGFPTDTHLSANYYVDVLFTQDPDTTAPTVIGQGPTANSTNVPRSTAVTVGFSEAIDPATALLSVQDGSGASVAGTLSYNGVSQTLAFQPSATLAASTTYTVTVSGARDLAGNTMAGTISWSFTTAEATPLSLWSGGAGPTGAPVVDPTAVSSGGVELGVKFRSTVAGQVLGVRFYKGLGNLGGHTGSLWSATGELLATLTFANETASGWQQAHFSSPVAIVPGQTYIVSYHTTTDHFVMNQQYFASSGFSSGPLRALADGEDGHNGVYLYGSGGFPTSSYRASNYWVDVLFVEGADTTAPTVVSRSPAANATDVARGTTITVGFSEAINPATAVLSVQDGSGAAVAGTLSYNAGTQTLSFQPAAQLAFGTTYTVTVGGATDLAGNVMAAPVSWSFTTVAADTTAPTVIGQGPAANSTDVPRSTAITASFSEAIDPATALLSVQDGTGAAVAGTVNYNATTHVLTFQPAVQLAFGATYTVTVSGARDLAGNAMASPVSWSFTTVAAADTTAPTVISQSPAANSSNVAWTTAIAVGFSEAIDSATALLSVQDGSGAAVAGTLSYNATTHVLTFQPSVILAASSIYTVSVSGAKDLVGNTMAGTISWSFTTVAATTGAYSLTQPDGSTASGWMYRRQVSIQNAGVALSDYQVRITLDSSFPFAHALSDGSDVRIVDASGKVIPYWIQSWDSAGRSASIWVRVPAIAGGATATLYVYYGNPMAPAFDLPPMGPFVKSPANPLLGNTLALPENIVQDPGTGRYWMAFSAGGNAIGLAWANSPDGPWTDAGRVLSGASQVSNSPSPHLLLDHGTWYLYYADNNWDIRLATAPFVTGPYTPFSSQPQLARGPAGSWDDSRVLEPYVFHDGTQWRMLYMGDAGAITEQIGQATAPNPWGPWTKDTANPVIGFGPSQSFDAGTVADPFAYKFGDTWYIFYAASETKNMPWENAVATTRDFVTFTKHNIVLNRGSTGSVDDLNAHRGALIRVGDYYYMSYTSVSSVDGTGKFRAAMARQYAKSTASGYAPEQVFGTYSDFTGTSLPDTWYQAGGTGGTSTVANGVLTINSGNGTYNQLQSGAQFGVGSMIEVRFRSLQADGTGNHSVQIGLGSLLGGDGLVRIMDSGSANWQIRATNGDGQTSVTDTGVPITSDWVTVRLAWAESGVIKYQINDNPWQQLTTNVPPDGTDMHAYLMAYAAPGYTTELQVDWVMVRKYAAIEPAIGLFPEEVANG